MNQSLKSTVKNVFVALMVTAVLNFGLPVYNTASAATPRFEKKSVSIYLGKTKALDLGKPANQITWKSLEKTCLSPRTMCEQGASYLTNRLKY